MTLENKREKLCTWYKINLCVNNAASNLQQFIYVSQFVQSLTYPFTIKPKLCIKFNYDRYQ